MTKVVYKTPDGATTKFPSISVPAEQSVKITDSYKIVRISENSYRYGEAPYLLARAKQMTTGMLWWKKQVVWWYTVGVGEWADIEQLLLDDIRLQYHVEKKRLALENTPAVNILMSVTCDGKQITVEVDDKTNNS